jgi:hypothetical protein
LTNTLAYLMLRLIKPVEGFIERDTEELLCQRILGEGSNQGSLTEGEVQVQLTSSLRQFVSRFVKKCFFSIKGS